MVTKASPAFREIRDNFLERHLEHWPGEATTMGLRQFDGRLKDLSPEAIADELELHRSSQRALEALEPSALTAEQEIDALTMSCLHDFHLHVEGQGQLHLTNMEMSLHPYQVVQFQQRLASSGDHWRDLSDRVGEIPRYLKEQRALLERGLDRGRTPDLDVAAFVATNQLPHVCRFFDTFADQPNVATRGSDHPRFAQRCREAAGAYSEHAEFLRRDLCPAASTEVLGPQEYGWRLRHSLGVDKTPSEAIEEASGILASLNEALLTLSSQLSGGRVDTPAKARAFVMQQRETLLTERDEDVLAAFEAIHDRACAHIRTHGLFDLDSAPGGLSLQALPRAFAELGNLANIAAPLLDPSGKAFFLIKTDAEAHAKIQATSVTVHDGFPGHGLQSIWWQTNPDRRAHPVRFLAVPDEIAVARHCFGAMMNIEGWASYAEVLMAETGFFSPQERLWELWMKIAHASRVVVDAGLHIGRLSVGAAESFLVEEAGWPRSWAVGEVNRYRRAPLQASSYLLGRLEILELRRQCQRQWGPAFNIADFHGHLFAAGPISAGHLRKAWLKQSPIQAPRLPATARDVGTKKGQKGDGADQMDL